MARYRIRQGETEVSIELTGVGDEKDQFIEALTECQEGRCECPTDEYAKLASMDVQDAGDTIKIRLETKAGQKLDTGQIEACLDHTSGKLR